MMKTRSSFRLTYCTTALAAAAMALRGVEGGARAYSSNSGVDHAIAVHTVLTSWWIFGAAGRAWSVLCKRA